MLTGVFQMVCVCVCVCVFLEVVFGVVVGVLCVVNPMLGCGGI